MYMFGCISKGKIGCYNSRLWTASEHYFNRFNSKQCDCWLCDRSETETKQVLWDGIALKPVLSSLLTHSAENWGHTVTCIHGNIELQIILWFV